MLIKNLVAGLAGSSETIYLKVTCLDLQVNWKTLDEEEAGACHLQMVKGELEMWRHMPDQISDSTMLHNA